LGRGGPQGVPHPREVDGGLRADWYLTQSDAHTHDLINL
jgi:hypothetical protein